MPKYLQLARHNSVCNEVFYQLQDCQREHPVKKFIGECTSFQKELEKCIRKNRENMRAKNLDIAKQRAEKMKSNASTNL